MPRRVKAGLPRGPAQPRRAPRRAAQRASSSALAVFGVALALCFWQNHLLLEIASGPLPGDHKKLITFGITEPFTTTVTVAAYGAIILSLPILLYQLYAYVLPAFSDARAAGRAADPAARSRSSSSPGSPSPTSS